MDILHILMHLMVQMFVS